MKSYISPKKFIPYSVFGCNNMLYNVLDKLELHAILKKVML